MLDPATNPAVLQQQDYAELKRRIVAAGLLEKQPGYYVFNASVRLAHLDASIVLPFIINNLWLQLLNAAFRALHSHRLAFLGMTAATAGAVECRKRRFNAAFLALHSHRLALGA